MHYKMHWSIKMFRVSISSWVAYKQVKFQHFVFFRAAKYILRRTHAKLLLHGKYINISTGT